MLRRLSNNRKQYVVVDNQASSMQFIKCGVPQGSVLGPVLFLLFIKLCNVSNLLKSVLYWLKSYRLSWLQDFICSVALAHRV